MVKKNGIGILWDVYNSGSLKQSAQENRGTEIRKRVVAHGKLPKKWQSLLRIKKTNLSCLN